VARDTSRNISAELVGGLNDRSLGWLRFMWDKATTHDDWSDQGEPHAWWDRYTVPPMCTFPRFDLALMGYVLPVMLESTPAWREVYIRIADELIRRYVTFWGAIDWCTLIGPDPNADRYPPEWQTRVPESLRGRYAMPGWTANGIEPWGLQPDPVGADGNLFYRGWLNLLLGIRRSVSGEAGEHDVLNVTGYQNREFPWTYARMSEFISAQFASRPQGPHCENTKIWPFCVSAAGLGLKLHDTLLGGTTHEPVRQWVDYARKHYLHLTRDGELDRFALYYDPIEEVEVTMLGPTGAGSILTVLQNLYPQDREFSIHLYELAMRYLRWDDPKVPMISLARDPLMLSQGLWMAREVGDSTTEDKIRKVDFQPRFFGAENDRFAFWFGLDSQWPRGQLNATMMLTECGRPGAWWRVFNEPNLLIYNQPTLRGVDYPNIGIRRAQNDMTRGILEIDTVAATPSRRGDVSSFTIHRVPNPADVSVTVDNIDYTRWRVSSADSIEMEVDINDHRIRVDFAGGSGEVA
jgi:hypothetical protein